MRILTSLTYYRPYTSGLTIYAERLAKALSLKGHQVSVLCMQHDRSLMTVELLDGVRIVRAPILFRLSKGFISLSFLKQAFKEISKCEIVHLHLPQFEGAWLAILAKLLGKPLIVTYHCDLIMPTGIFNKLAGSAVHLMNHITAKLAKRIITYTEDFAKHSPFLKRYINKVEVVFPPVTLPEPLEKDHISVKERSQIGQHKPCIGMAARLAAEKGVEVLVDAIEILKKSYPLIKVLFAGPYQDVIGESAYRVRILPRIKELEKSGNWVFLGNLTPQEMSAFYQLLDVLTVPSLNSTESFGLVQIEAMQRGVPVVSSNLPGVRQPVVITEMGRVVAISDSAALAAAISELITKGKIYTQKSEEIIKMFHPSTCADKYEMIYKNIL